MTRHYRGLKFIGMFLKIAGGIEAVIGASALIFVPLVLGNADSALAQLGLPLTQNGAGLWTGIVLGVALMFIGVVTGLLTFALGDLINVAIAIEENTRTKPTVNRVNPNTSA